MTELTIEQIAEAAADPALSLAALEMDERDVLRTVLVTMCLDAKCRGMFERVMRSCMGEMRGYTPLKRSDNENQQRWMEELLACILHQNDTLRSFIDYREEVRRATRNEP